MSFTSVTSKGRVWVLNGRGSYSDLENVGSAGILHSFDEYAAWVIRHKRKGEEDISPAARQRVVKACREGEVLLKLPLAERIAMFEAEADPVPLLGEVS